MKRILTAASVIAALILAGCASNTVDTAGVSKRTTKVASSSTGTRKVAYAGNIKVSKKIRAAQKESDRQVLFPGNPEKLAPERSNIGVVSPNRSDYNEKVGQRVAAAFAVPDRVTSGRKKQVVIRRSTIEKSGRVNREGTVSSYSKKRGTTVKSARVTGKKRSFGYSAPKVSRSNSGGAYQSAVTRYARAYGVPVSLAHAIVRVESGYRANARGGAGEVGLMQIKPATARMMGYRGSARGLYNPETNLKYGMKYLAQAHRLGGRSVCGTVLKYNAGHGAKRMNPISARYCSKVKRIIRS